MGKESVKGQAAGPWCCENLAARMTGHFCAHLEAEARKTGGNLTIAQLKEATARFLRDSSPFQPVYQRSYDDCTRARETAAWELARRYPFDRILIKRLAHLFPARSGDDGSRNGGGLSRRVIPGFNLVLNKMIGPNLYEQCQVKAQAIVERHRLGPQLDWEGVYADVDSRALANDVLVVVAHYFSNFDKRRDWFIAIVNGHLAPAAQGSPDEHWQLTEPVFHRLLRALFADLNACVASNSRRLRDRYGDDTFETLVDFLTHLDNVG